MAVYHKELDNIRISFKDNKAEEFAKMNPFLKVPVMKDGDFALAESVSIFRYLGKEYH